MSFILDALRKSDARRQQAGAPGLNSPEPPRPRRRRRRLLPGLATAVVLVAVLATAAYVVRPGWLPVGSGDNRQARVDDGERPSPDTESGSAHDRLAESSKAVSAEMQQAARAEPAADDEAQADPTADAEATEQASTQSERTRERRRRRVPPSESDGVVQEESPQRESEPVPADEATEELERRMAEAADRRRETPEQAPDEPEETRQPDREATEPAAEEDTESGTEELSEDVAEYVRAWELPLSVRRSLPELNLTIHVYSPNEPERFVLINGERHVAGDEIDGARIVDIRREGAIVDFRSHRFLLEPR